ncbi:MAG TPA: IS110 family transposase [Thermoanaerobaculia bacterium]|nr:IS110 family transposase [Thermoanaerobaculia bacterium]
MFVGIDWASRAHELCVVDEEGLVVKRFGFAHSERGIADALERLAKLACPGELPVAIERPDGLLVGRLLEGGHPVVPIHPNAFHAARPRWEGAGSKSDPGDAYRLADLLRTDHHRLRELQPLDAATRELQALVRLRDDHVAARVAATNQLAALLAEHWPGAAAVFGRLDSEIALSFLDRYPSPESTARLGETRLAAFLTRHRYSGRRSADELLERLRAAPQPVHALHPGIVTELVRTQARLVRTLLASIAELDRAIAATLDQHAKAQLLRPLPRIGTINLAQIVAEVGPLLDRTANADEAAALCGAAPVTKRSGQQRAVCFRHATNAKARKALTLYADNSRHASPWAERIYRDTRARGCRHPHAVRILARAWLRVIWACWHTETPYDPARRRGRDSQLQPATLT